MTDTIAALTGDHLDVLVRLETVDEHLDALRAAIEELSAFVGADLERHFALEEEALFPVLARHRDLEEGPLRVMREEHVACRELVERLAAAVRQDRVAAQIETTQAIIDLLRAHIAKEDTVLFAVARATLNADELREVERRGGSRR